MNKVLDYQILEASMSHQLAEMVAKAIWEGWQPLGSMVATIDLQDIDRFYQPMVKYEWPGERFADKGKVKVNYYVNSREVAKQKFDDKQRDIYLQLIGAALPLKDVRWLHKVSLAVSQGTSLFEALRSVPYETE